ncbi:MAG: pentapeptide repeat-containing protein [Bacteroidota bacterium]
MEEQLHQDKTFEKISYVGKTVHKREFENCEFRNCDFSTTDFSWNRFTDCVFTDCNLSNIKLESTRLGGCTFTNCKMLGIHFVECEDFMFKVTFINCMLDYSSFMFKKLAKTLFKECSLRGVGFGGCNLSQAVFDKSELDGAVFRETDLTGANFTSARNYIIHPESNTIKGAKFSIFGLPGLLEGYDIQISAE